MKIESYNPTDMTMLSADVTGVDFGVTIKGQHSTNVIVVRPVATSETLTELALFLEDNDGLDHTQFGKYKSSVATPGITPGSNYLSDYFIPVPGVSDTSMLTTLSDFGLVYTPSSPEYTWVDAEAGVSETEIGSSSVNLRFVFEYI